MEAHEIKLEGSDELETFQLTGGTIATVVPVKRPAVVTKIINASEQGEDGRSPWVWVRLASGDLILGVFPQGDTYFATESETERP